MTPRNFVSEISFIVFPLAVIEIGWVLGLVVHNIICVLSRLIINLFAANHSSTFLNSTSIFVKASLRSSEL